MALGGARAGVATGIHIDSQPISRVEADGEGGGGGGIAGWEDRNGAVYVGGGGAFEFRPATSRRCRPCCIPMSKEEGKLSNRTL